VLFDEVEKAHPDVFNTLLQLLDDGRLTDSQGRTVDFRNTVVILTSNVGSAEIAAIEEQVGLSDVEKSALAREQAMVSLRSVFRPEFLNRLDEIVAYQRLSRPELRRVVDIQLGRLAKRLTKRDLSLVISDAAKDHLAEIGFDPQFGARPLKRAIQRHLEDPLARKVLAGEFELGDEISVGFTDGELTFSVRGKGDPAAVSAA
jgi:ATP-dependent Clp protease ATP-binding subunit ClpB